MSPPRAPSWGPAAGSPPARFAPGGKAAARIAPALLAGLVLGWAGASACSPQSPCGPPTGTVANVVDGDTVDLESGVRIRYLNVDTPESTGGKNDCWGQQAAQANRDLVLGQQVTLTYDVECTDKYGRTLAYLKVGTTDVSKTLVETGNACVLVIPPNGADRKTEFEDAQSVAKTNRTGLWGACTTVTCGG